MYHSHTKKSKPAIPKSRIIIGRKPLLEAISAGREIEKIFLLQSAVGAEISEIKHKASQLNIAISFVPQEKLQRFTQGNHQGVVAIAGLVQYHTLQDIIDITVDAGKTPLIVLLDGVTDTRNLGAIARSAYCFGADALILPVSNTASITEDAIKTSAGALENLMVCRVPSVEQALDILHLNGIHTVAAALDEKGIELEEAALHLPVTFILGAEDKGVSKYVLKNAKDLVRIPMPGNFDSLNVSVAAGIILYETYRLRRLKN